MLRKSSHTILSILLLLATFGLAISEHYCGENLISTSINGEAEPCCDKEGCCKNELVYFQLDEDCSLVSVSEIPRSCEIELMNFAVLIFSTSELKAEDSESLFVADVPPPPKIQTILSQNQTYLL